MRLIVHAVRIKRPFIAVNINYRLNVFGFLASDILSAVQPHMKGCNFGLTDEARAIEWIAANIYAFGGNPNKITIGGQSAGATSVYAHALRTLHGHSNRLFHACVIQSPAAGICGPFAMTHASRRLDHVCERLGLLQHDMFRDVLVVAQMDMRGSGHRCRCILELQRWRYGSD